MAWFNGHAERSWIEFPELASYQQWLISTAQEIGLSNGDRPTPYSEINAWCSISGITLTLWEVETMKYFSSLYISLLHEYSDKDAQRPYITEGGIERYKKEDAARMRAFMLSKAKA